MSWLIKWNGTVTDSDDFTIADLGYAEKRSGTPWSVSNVWTDIAVAAAFLAVVMRRSGMSEDEITAALAEVRRRDLEDAFDWRADDEGVGETEEPDPSVPLPDSTTGGSSPGELEGASPPA